MSCYAAEGARYCRQRDKVGGELVKQVCEHDAQAAKNAAPVAIPSEDIEVLSLSATLKKAREEADSAKIDLDALCAAA